MAETVPDFTTHLNNWKKGEFPPELTASAGRTLSSPQTSGSGSGSTSITSSTSAGGGGYQQWSASDYEAEGERGMNKTQIGISVLTVAALIIGNLAWEWSKAERHTYNNSPAGMTELAIEKAKVENEKLKLLGRTGGKEPPGSGRDQVLRPANGERLSLSEGVTLVLNGPKEVVFEAGSADKIKHAEGEFELWVENSENWSWTSGWDSEKGRSPYRRPKEFVDKFREVGQRIGSTANMRVRVKPGATAQFNT